VLTLLRSRCLFGGDRLQLRERVQSIRPGR
jgi:hypothetical protein